MRKMRGRGYLVGSVGGDRLVKEDWLSKISLKSARGQWVDLAEGTWLQTILSCRCLLHYTPASTKLKGGYTGFTLSVCPSVRSVSSTILTDPFHICTSYPSNFRRCVACNVCFKIEILVNSLNFWLWLCLLFTWDPIWLNGMGNHEAAGGILRTQAF